MLGAPCALERDVLRCGYDRDTGPPRPGPIARSPRGGGCPLAAPRPCKSGVAANGRWIEASRPRVGYANYMQADEPIERVRAMFAEGAFDRLQALKRRYDPDNVLRRNQNIPPGQ